MSFNFQIIPIPGFNLCHALVIHPFHGHFIQTGDQNLGTNHGSLKCYIYRLTKEHKVEIGDTKRKAQN